jgi:hypothetical protein
MESATQESHVHYDNMKSNYNIEQVGSPTMRRTQQLNFS